MFQISTFFSRFQLFFPDFNFFPISIFSRFQFFSLFCSTIFYTFGTQNLAWLPLSDFREWGALHIFYDEHTHVCSGFHMNLPVFMPKFKVLPGLGDYHHAGPKKSNHVVEFKDKSVTEAMHFYRFLIDFQYIFNRSSKYFQKHYIFTAFFSPFQVHFHLRF